MSLRDGHGDGFVAVTVQILLAPTGCEALASTYSGSLAMLEVVDPALDCRRRPLPDGGSGGRVGLTRTPGLRARIGRELPIYARSLHW